MSLLTMSTLLFQQFTTRLNGLTIKLLNFLNKNPTKPMDHDYPFSTSAGNNDGLTLIIKNNYYTDRYDK